MTKRCSMPNCDNRFYAREWCQRHYQRFKRTGSPTDPLPPTEKCSVEGCDNKHYGLQLCQRHYLRIYYDRIRRTPTKQCVMDGCSGRRTSKLGYCGTHMRRLKRFGSVYKNGSKSVAERFWEKVNKDGPMRYALLTPCWLWTGSTNESGYGGFCYQGKRHSAAYISWLLTFGRFPSSQVLRHQCDNPPCVNPSHLLEGTFADNSRDMIERGRHYTQKRRGNGNELHPLDSLETA